ncbi:hypothetical protein BDV23DRAFT_189479 [Aspergillus alliaceus]|uniref:BTB domain-containing protein n=1 Tax=Petromyces alliaceus TaxID=209559 RepID=A0A5N7BQU4_PETAA|nr:hypothetical protein BDV23DRAFT_189479 [Aspergillus alliaceus]
MSSLRHQSSLEGVLDFSEPFSLTPQQSYSAKRLLDIFIKDYGLDRATERGYKPAKLICTTLDHIIAKDTFLSFFLTYLHENLTDLTSNITLALSYFEDIVSREPAPRSDVMNALEAFADYMVTQFFLPLRASSVKTPQPTPTTLSAIQASTAVGTKQRISFLRRDCLIRDRHRCVVSRKFDITEARRRLANNEKCEDDNGKLLETEPRDNFQYLEVAHILPHCLTKVASADGDLTDSKRSVLRILDMFDPGITHLIDGPNIDSPSNALTLTLENHRLFGEFQIYFESTDRPHEYKIYSVESGFLSDPFFPVTRALTRSPNDTINLPSPRLLSIHRAIAHILKLSGAGEYIEKIVRDLEQVTVEADGSTNLGDIHLVGILKSLLSENIFINPYSAQRAFPELFPEAQNSQTALQTPTRGTPQDLFGMEGPSRELLDSFKMLYSSGQYSDLTISSNKKDYRVHRAIVCPRSSFFSTALRGDFKEGHEGTISFQEDDPQIVDIMINYFYHLDYNVFSQENGMDSQNPRSEIFEVPQAHSSLTIHAKVYCLGEKYLISSLKALALQKFKATAREQWDVNDFLEAAKQAYTSTIETDRGLKDAVIAVLYDHSELLDREEAQFVFKELNMLTYDLLMYIHGKDRF